MIAVRLYVSTNQCSFSIKIHMKSKNLWPLKSNQFIFEFKRTFVLNLKKFPQDAPEMLSSQNGLNGKSHLPLSQRHKHENILCQSSNTCKYPYLLFLGKKTIHLRLDKLFSLLERNPQRYKLSKNSKCYDVTCYMYSYIHKSAMSQWVSCLFFILLCRITVWGNGIITSSLLPALQFLRNTESDMKMQTERLEFL